MNDDLRIAELLCSRLCHDLVSPVGAVNNGVELMEEFGGASDEAMALIGTSGRQAARRLQYYRIAFGLAGSQIAQSLDDVKGIVAGFVEGGKATVEWDAAGGQTPETPGWGKLLLNLVALASEALPRGGTLRISAGADAGKARLAVAASGPGCRLHEDIREALNPTVKVEALNARGAQPYFAVRLAARMGGKLEIAEPGQDQMTFAVTIPNVAG
ncbi:MAG: histidine phosphotransferase [Alphaproteobacteria bacterium]|nr:histidine phosphotransferase [Alphaproteobacteria bacterium]